MTLKIVELTIHSTCPECGETRLLLWRPLKSHPFCALGITGTKFCRCPDHWRIYP